MIVYFSTSGDAHCSGGWVDVGLFHCCCCDCFHQVKLSHQAKVPASAENSGGSSDHAQPGSGARLSLEQVKAQGRAKLREAQGQPNEAIMVVMAPPPPRNAGEASSSSVTAAAAAAGAGSPENFVVMRPGHVGMFVVNMESENEPRPHSSIRGRQSEKGKNSTGRGSERNM